MTPRRILSISGGKDSTAMYLLALEMRDRFGTDFEAVFADTGNEHEATLDYVHELPIRTGGPDVRWIKADSAAIARESGIDGMLRWAKTLRGGKIYNMFTLLPPPVCQSEYGLCE